MVALADARAVVRRALDEIDVVTGSDQWSRIAGQHDDWECPEDGIDGPPLEPELTQVGSREQGVRRRYQSGGAGTTRRLHATSVADRRGAKPWHLLTFASA